MLSPGSADRFLGASLSTHAVGFGYLKLARLGAQYTAARNNLTKAGQEWAFWAER